MTKLYGLKNCDKCRAASKWLATNGIKHTMTDVRDEPVSEATLESWLDALGLASIVNKRSTTWKQLTQEERDGLTEANAVALLQQHPTLLKRPVLVTADGVYNGFTEAAYNTIFTKA